MGFHQFVGFEINDIKQTGAEVCGEKVFVVIVNREIVKALSFGSRKFNRRHL
jgi:hypothetical protein